jgi:hypothetical protein
MKGDCWWCFGWDGQGYALMASEIPEKRRSDRSERTQLGEKFKVKWQKVCDLQFFKTNDLRNEYNENKPVKVGRDGQEIAPETGRAVVELMESCPDVSVRGFAVCT